MKDTNIPSHMTAIVITAPGGPDVLKPQSVPTPEPQGHEVLIKVKAAGVNRPDCMQRQGLYPAPLGASPYPGLEIAGEVVALGPTATLHLGDEVCALVHGGGYGQYAIAQEIQCLPKPTHLSWIKAAALPETLFTVWSMVFMRGRLQPKERLLVHGGTSGIGTMAISLAKAFGHEIAVTAGTNEKCKFAMDLGATLAINYKEESWPDIIKDWGGVDVILDMVAGPYVPQGLDILKSDGRYLILSLIKGATSEINMGKVMMKRLTITGATLRAQSDDQKAIIAKNLKEKVWPLIENGEIIPVIDEVFPFEQAGKAHTKMEQGQHKGKIILSFVS